MRWGIAEPGTPGGWTTEDGAGRMPLRRPPVTPPASKTGSPAQPGSPDCGVLLKALVKAKSEPGLWLEDVPEPPVGPNDVLIGIRKTGVCGTDLHIYQWDSWAKKTIPVPMVVGHEFVGEVLDTGSNVTTSTRGRSSAARGTSSAGAAGTVSPAAGTCAPTRSGWA